MRMHGSNNPSCSLGLWEHLGGDRGTVGTVDKKVFSDLSSCPLSAIIDVFTHFNLLLSL